MIPSARPTSPPVVIIIFKRRLFCFCDILKLGTDVRTETCAKVMVTNGRDYGSVEWINKTIQDQVSSIDF